MLMSDEDKWMSYNEWRMFWYIGNMFCKLDLIRYSFISLHDFADTLQLLLHKGNICQ